MSLPKHKGSVNETSYPWAIDVSCVDYSNMQRFLVLCLISSLANSVIFLENF